jgi:hypothetical protein
MALRACDEPVMKYLRIKKHAVESDHRALIGSELHRVFIYEAGGTRQLLVDLDENWFVADTVPGFVRFERIPEETPLVEKPVSSEPAKLAGSTWAETRQNAEEQARQTLTEQQAARRASSGIGITSNKWQAFSDAAYRARNNK